MKELRIIRRDGMFDIIGVFVDNVLVRQFKKRVYD